MNDILCTGTSAHMSSFTQGRRRIVSIFTRHLVSERTKLIEEGRPSGVERPETGGLGGLRWMVLANLPRTLVSRKGAGS